MKIFSLLFRGRKDRRPGRSGTVLRRRSPVRLYLEPLEDRSLPSSSSISGYVFNDANNNGLIDSGEQPIAGNPIALVNAAGALVGTAITDANGFYQFTTDATINTTPTTLVRSASVSLTPTDWVQGLTIPQFDPSLGTLTAIDLVNVATFNSDIKVESLDQAPSTITATDSGSLTLSGPALPALVTPSASSQSFNASAFDGTVDFGGTSGHDFGWQTASGSNQQTLTAPGDLAAYIGTGTVTLTEVAHATSHGSGAGNLLTQINTQASAQLAVVYHYIPSNALRPGNYIIVQTSQPPGYLPGQVSSGGVVLPTSLSSRAIPITLNGGNSTDNDFGELLPAGLAGYVYLDNNNDGTLDPGDTGIPGVVVTLTGTNDLGPVQVATVTAGDGSYQFPNLRPGTYTITKTPPPGYLDGQLTPGTAGGTVGNEQFVNIGLAQGVTGLNYDFGERLPPTPVGVVSTDAPPAIFVPLSKADLLNTSGPLNADPSTPAFATFVEGISRAILGRPADAAGLTGWVTELVSGVSRAQVVAGIWSSDEHLLLEINSLYLALLHRPADPVGQSTWLSLLRTGVPVAQLAEQLILSGEYQADYSDDASFVASLYANVLGRQPSAAELNGWVQALQAGVGRQDVALGILTSSEADGQQIDQAYLQYLGRPADPGGRQTWLGLLTSGQASPDSMRQALLASDEFFADAVQASQQ